MDAVSFRFVVSCLFLFFFSLWRFTRDLIFLLQQRVLEHCDNSNTQQIIMDEIMKSVCTLAQDQYGNYVIQVFPLYVVRDKCCSSYVFFDEKVNFILFLKII